MAQEELEESWILDDMDQKHPCKSKQNVKPNRILIWLWFVWDLKAGAKWSKLKARSHENVEEYIYEGR